MNISLNTIAGTESDFEKMRAGTEAGGVYQVNKYQAGRTQSAVSVDLGSSLFNTDAYGTGARTSSDIMAEAQNTEMSVRHNYMSVMANTLSTEDFIKGAEEGFDLSETGADETVTILDKIKAVLAGSGQNIVGYTDDLSAKQLSKITGNSALAEQIASSFQENDIPITEQNINEVMETVERMSEATELDTQALKYMTLNELAPTMDNLYLAMHVSNGQHASGRGFIQLEADGYYAQKADNINWESIKDQAERVIEEAGLPNNEENGKRARWMVEESIPLTAENLKTVDALSKLKLPMNEKDIIDSAAKAIANKNAASFGLVTGQDNNLKKAVEITDKTGSLDSEDAMAVTRDNKTLNLKNLFEAHEERNNDVQTQGKGQQEDKAETVITADDVKNMEARKQLEQVRLQMSVTVSQRLIDKGFPIDTAPLNQLIERLSDEIEEISKTLFPVRTGEEAVSSVSKYNLYEETNTKIAGFKSYPAALVARISGDNSLENIIETGYRLKMRYEKAGMTYEAVGTAPRADMGDSIKKAFRNVDDILKDLGEQVTEENKRVVRILGYNRMDITKENIENVRTADEKLMSTIDKLKPAAVLKMIREDKNPLNMTLDELSSELDRHDKDSSGQEEKYARFLYKLERNNEISPEEKASYIGIFRLFANLKKTDNAAIGAVLETGAEMTIKNLLSAQRTIKAQRSGMDVKVDDSLKNVESRQISGVAIDTQIETAFMYYSQKADVVYRNLEPEKLSKAEPDDDTLLDELADKLQQADENIEADRQYYSERTRQIRNTLSANGEDVLEKELTEYEIEITAYNLEAINLLRQGRRGRNSVWNQAERIAHLAFKETEKEMLEELGGIRDYSDSYAEHLSELSESLTELIAESEQIDNYVDVRAIHLMQKQISVATRMAYKGSYEIPVEVDGRTVSMHVTMKDSAKEGTKISASLETIDFGHISMAMTIDGGEVKGIFALALSKNEELAEYINEVKERFIKELSANEPDLAVDSKNIGIMYHTTDAGDAVQGAEKGISESRSLLRMAAIFVNAV